MKTQSQLQIIQILWKLPRYLIDTFTTQSACTAAPSLTPSSTSTAGSREPSLCPACTRWHLLIFSDSDCLDSKHNVRISTRRWGGTCPRPGWGPTATTSTSRWRRTTSGCPSSSSYRWPSLVSVTQLGYHTQHLYSLCCLWQTRGEQQQDDYWLWHLKFVVQSQFKLQFVL